MECVSFDFFFKSSYNQANDSDKDMDEVFFDKRGKWLVKTF